MNTRVLDTAASPVWTVSQLNRMVGQLLQAQFAGIWVRGEISNFTQAASGHWYFSIKDGAAMVRAVMFRSRAQASGIQPRVGDQFEFFASATLYEARGEYQLQIETLRRAGRGDLHEAFLQLKEKLATEGLFAPERKRPLPSMPAAIGVVTSLAAAALRDVLTTLRRRAPHVPIIVYPAPVQGRDAAPQLLDALTTAYARAEVDVLLLVRGGGSIEDLWSFNDEALARTVAVAPMPVICGVGHETDFTICDFVADVRAPTPTAAAELVCRARDDCMQAVRVTVNQLDAVHQRLRERAAMRLDRAVAGLVSPEQRLGQQREQLRALTERLARALSASLERQRARLSLQALRVSRCTPSMQAHRDRLDVLSRRMDTCARHQPMVAQQRLRSAIQALHALDPHQVLARGYAIVRNGNQDIVKNALDLRVGETLGVEFQQGTAQVTVTGAHALL